MKLNNGAKVKGIYHGKPFQGYILESRHHTVNHDLFIVTVKLNEPLHLYGTDRDSILIDYFFSGRINPDSHITEVLE